jgi:hypothetical protein
MDYAACNIIYVDRAAGEERLVKRGSTLLSQEDPQSKVLLQLDGSANGELRCADHNVQTLLGIFGEGWFWNGNAI